MAGGAQAAAVAGMKKAGFPGPPHRPLVGVPKVRRTLGPPVMTRLKGKNSRDEYLLGPLHTAAPGRNTYSTAEPR